MPKQLRMDFSAIAPLGRSDSETQFRIIATLLSVYGRTRLLMEHEVKPLGALFNGQNTFPGPPADIGNDGSHTFSRTVFGLSPGTLYHWRVRAKYDLAKTPFQRNGPWVHMPTNGWNEADLRTAGSPPVNVMERPVPDRLELRAAGSNPGHGRCGVLLVISQPARVRVDVLDLRGRRVATLAERWIETAGSHVLMWDGRDRRRAQAAAGVYFVRARLDEGEAVRKVVMTR